MLSDKVNSNNRERFGLSIRSFFVNRIMLDKRAFLCFFVVGIYFLQIKAKTLLTKRLNCVIL